MANGIYSTSYGQSTYTTDGSFMEFSASSRVYMGGFQPGFMVSAETKFSYLLV